MLEVSAASRLSWEKVKRLAHSFYLDSTYCHFMENNYNQTTACLKRHTVAADDLYSQNMRHTHTKTRTDTQKMLSSMRHPHPQNQSFINSFVCQNQSVSVCQYIVTHTPNHISTLAWAQMNSHVQKNMTLETQDLTFTAA